MDHLFTKKEQSYIQIIKNEAHMIFTSTHLKQLFSPDFPSHTIIVWVLSVVLHHNGLKKHYLALCLTNIKKIAHKYESMSMKPQIVEFLLSNRSEYLRPLKSVSLSHKQ